MILDTSLSEAIEEARSYFDANYSMSISFIRELIGFYYDTDDELELIETIYLLGFMQGQKKK